MTAAAFEDALPELGSSRPVWLMTLADLALLLIGFFVFLQASQTLDRHALAKGLREGFGVRDSARTEPADPIAVSVGALRGFAPGSAVATQSPDALIAWAREATRDRRVTLRIAGAVDGSPGDVDPVTGSGALLVAHAVPADRLSIVSTARPLGRSVTVSTGFAGAGTRLPPGNPNLPPQRTPR